MGGWPRSQVASFIKIWVPPVSILRPGIEFDIDSISRSLPVKIDGGTDASLKRQARRGVIEASGTRIEAIACIVSISRRPKVILRGTHLCARTTFSLRHLGYPPGQNVAWFIPHHRPLSRESMKSFSRSKFDFGIKMRLFLRHTILGPDRFELPSMFSSDAFAAVPPSYGRKTSS